MTEKEERALEEVRGTYGSALRATMEHMLSKPESTLYDVVVDMQVSVVCDYEAGKEGDDAISKEIEIVELAVLRLVMEIGRDIVQQR